MPEQHVEDGDVAVLGRVVARRVAERVARVRLGAERQQLVKARHLHARDDPNIARDQHCVLGRRLRLDTDRLAPSRGRSFGLGLRGVVSSAEMTMRHTF